MEGYDLSSAETWRGDGWVSNQDSYGINFLALQVQWRCIFAGFYDGVPEFLEWQGHLFDNVSTGVCEDIR
jgi:hypothetical protein